jgi:hypothetical protein
MKPQITQITPIMEGRQKAVHCHIGSCLYSICVIGVIGGFFWR